MSVANPGYLGNCIRQIIAGDDDGQSLECDTQVSLYPDVSSLCLAVHQVSDSWTRKGPSLT